MRTILTLALLIATLTLTGCDSTTETSATTSTEPTHGVMRVTPIKPSHKPLVRLIEYPGQVEAFEETAIHAKLAGFVKKVHVDIGDQVTGPSRVSTDQPVQPGQILAELEMPELDAELKQKQAFVAQAAAEVTQSKAGIKVAMSAKSSAEALVAEARASVERTDAMYERWKSEFERVRELVEKKAVAQKVADETEQQFKAADAARREIAAKIKSTQAKLSESAANIEKADADLIAAQSKQKVAEADEQKTRALLSYATLRAPFDGVITERHLDTGHLVQPNAASGKPLFVVVRADTVRVFLDVPEADAGFVATNSPAKIKVPSLSKSFEGKVTRTAWTLQTSSRTLRTEIDVPNPNGQLRPGMYATAEIEVARRIGKLSLPKSAILTEGAESFCLSISSKNTLEKLPIKTGIVAGPDVEIISGLTGDESVIGANLAAYNNKVGEAVEVITAK
ncbi:MAG: efflux RND transporter periplasmic adaptor subunit [Planctomycetota bacterium]|nr:MAG: efflux RND transporter periplasmic adaptor subunit [Planctomycetota bacterium]GDY08294.1 hemolysin D [Planctomycetia bacterium]